jgi:hypothetical protein
MLWLKKTLNVAANMFNKQLNIIDKGWSSNWGVGRGDYDSKIELVVMKCHNRPWGQPLMKPKEKRKGKYLLYNFVYNI